MFSTNDQQGMAQMNNRVQISIDGRIRGLARPSSWPKIFQVPHYLRKLNEEAYEPTIISVGPYHRQKDHLKAMETHKERFLKDLLQRSNENSAQKYVDAMTNMMERARKCYSKSLSISDEDFLEMMVLDGCFILELIYKIEDGSWNQDSILKVAQIFYHILRDLRLVENQIPFFVLWELFSMMTANPSNYISCILMMFEGGMPGGRICQTYNENSMENVKHLVDLLRINWLPSEELMHEYNLVKNGGNWSFIPSATELKKRGIKLKKYEGSNLLDIKFANGKLYIPVVRIDEGTETLFRNIIACEQFDDSESPKYFCEYRKVMDCLINTGKDVELLRRKGIIDNWLDTNEAVVEMFNALGSGVILTRHNFFYVKLFNDVNKHYYLPWNKRMANLRYNYFNTLRASTSFFAAAFMLLLTLLQATFTIFPRSQKVP